MKHTLAAVSAVALLFSLSALSVAQEFERSFASKVTEEVSEHQSACVDRIAEEWSKPEIADEKFTKLTLEFVLNRVQNGQEAVVFYGKTFNRFLQLERETTVTCSIADQAPVRISIRMAR